MLVVFWCLSCGIRGENGQTVLRWSLRPHISMIGKKTKNFVQFRRVTSDIKARLHSINRVSFPTDFHCTKIPQVLEHGKICTTSNSLTTQGKDRETRRTPRCWTGDVQKRALKSGLEGLLNIGTSGYKHDPRVPRPTSKYREYGKDAHQQYSKPHPRSKSNTVGPTVDYENGARRPSARSLPVEWRDPWN